MRFVRAAVAAVLLAVFAAVARAESWIEPVMRLAPERGPPTIALTLDACGGKADMRIIDALIAGRVPATIFVSGIWLRRNQKALLLLLAHPDLFQIENHGHRHLPAIDRPGSVYGLPAAGSAEGVAAEIEAGRADIERATGQYPSWYRGAGALYTRTSMALIEHLGQRLAGYSLAGDGGARLSRAATLKRMLGARDGEVILVHANHPERPSGQGVADAIVELRHKGFRFVRLASPGLKFIYRK